MSNLSPEVKKELEKLALKTTEKLMELAVDNFRETLKRATLATDLNVALFHNAALKQVEESTTKIPG